MKQWRSKQGPGSHYAARRAEARIRYKDNHPFQVAASAARVRASRKKLEFDITGQYLERLYEKQQGLCYYTGEPMLINSGCGVRSFSVDRIDSSIGYTKKNTVLCRSAINRMKNDHNMEDFVRWCKQVAVHSP